ncbi:MAG: hypothetical protein Q8O89_05505 [Nanoarchaeota archaeon]|nr:hypothetical protein [Nanoarchaeota archaeon]
MSHLSIPLSIFEKFALAAILIKVFNFNNYVIVGVIGAAITILLFVLGHYDLKNGIAERETSLNNQYNPELQTIYNNVAEKSRKGTDKFRI